MSESATVERFEDMSPDGRLRLTFQSDGDVILSVIESAEAKASGLNPTSSEVEFCTHAGGGKSKRTLAALRSLALAIWHDNLEEDTRRGNINQDIRPWFPAYTEIAVEETIPLRLCVDLLMENIRTINEFRHLAIPDQGLSILGHFVISDTLSDLRSKVEQAVREMAKGGSE